MLGGTSYFGRRAVKLLVDDGVDVTIGTRGTTPDGFGPSVRRVVLDRTDRASLSAAVGSHHYDAVIDQICYDPAQAQIGVEVLGNRVDRYVFTSSMAVYTGKDTTITEDDFDPWHYPYDLGASLNYAEGKRQAEAYFFQHAPCPVVAVRAGMVVSADDATGRFQSAVTRIARGQPVLVPADDHKVSFVEADRLAGLLRVIAQGAAVKGPINAVGSDFFSPRELAAAIADAIGTAPTLETAPYGTPAADGFWPYAMGPWTWMLSNAKAAALGYDLGELRASLPAMVRGVLAAAG